VAVVAGVVSEGVVVVQQELYQQELYQQELYQQELYQQVGVATAVSAGASLSALSLAISS
jgi:hypothetical protein